MRQSIFVMPVLLGLFGLMMLAPALAVPTAAEKAFAAAKQLYDMGSDQQAIKVLQEYLAAYPTDMQVHEATYMLGRCYQRQYQYPEALNSYTRVITNAATQEFAPLRARTHFQMAECYLAQKDYERAIRSYDNCLTLSKPTDELAVSAQYWKAECFYRLSRFDNAVVEYRKVPQTSPSHALASWSLYSIGMIELQRARYTEAIPALETVNTRYKDSEVIGDALYALGFAYAARARAAIDPLQTAARQEDFRKAIAVLTQVMQSEKTTQSVSQQAGLALAQIYFDQEDYAKAEAAYADILTRMKPTDPQAMDTRLWHAHALFNAGRYRDAIIAYGQMASSKDPEQVAQALYWQGSSWHQLALASKDAGEYRAAIAAFLRFLAAAGDKHPRAARATLLMAYCAEDLAAGDDAKARADALTAFNQILTKWPSAREVPDALAGIARLTVTMSPEELRNVVGTLPEGAAAWGVNLRLAREEFLAGRYEGALSAARKVLDAKPVGELRAQASYLAAASLHKLNRPADAIEHYQQVLASGVQGELLPFAYRGMTQAYLDTKRYREARDAALKLAEFPLSEKERAEALMFLAEAYSGNQQTAEALTIYQRVAQELPDSSLAPNAMMGVGWLAETRKDYTLAVTTYRGMIFKYPNHDLVPEAFYHLGVSLVEQKDYAAAIEAFKNVPDTHKLAPQAIYAIAWALRDQGNPAQANEQFARLADKFPAHALATDSLFRIGDSFLEQKRYAEALRHFSRAADLAQQGPLAPLIQYKLGVCAYFANDFPLAANAFGRVMAMDPNGEYAAESLFWRAQAQEKAGGADKARVAAARELYLQYVTKYPGHTFVLDAALGAGRAALAAGQLAAAREDLQQALTLSASLGNTPGNAARTERAKNVQPEAQFFLGQTFFEEKKYAEALKEFAAVAVYQLEPWYSRSMLQMAHCNMGLGDRQAALRSLQLLLRNFPESDAAKEAPAVARQYSLELAGE